MEKLRLLPDVPWGESLDLPKTAAEQDGLRFHQYAEILARAALDTPEPFTIGIYGGWGSGKTSLMRMIMKVVEQEENAVPVWFNAWRYEKEEHLIVPLLATIITEIESRKPKLQTAIKKGAGKLIDAFRGVLYGVSVKGKVGIPGLSEAELSISAKEAIERYQQINKEIATDSILERSLYFRAFSQLDEIAKEKNGPRLVVFVDDLDRCFPDKAVALLEGIKLVLHQPNIAFVLGVAPRVIQAYLQAKYRKDYNIPEDLYEDYLEKLVQLPFPIPEIRQNVEEYVRRLLKREDVFGPIDKDRFQAEYEPLVSICGPACKDNPRAIVRFLNHLLIMKTVHEAKSEAGQAEKISLVHFGITTALELKWPRILAACERNLDVPVSDQKAMPLCSYLAEIFKKHGADDQDRDLISELNACAKDDTNPSKDVFRSLADDDSLRRLFRSKPGVEWLEKPELRRAVQTTAREVRTQEAAEKRPPRMGVPWAEGYSEAGWPMIRGHEIKPDADLVLANLVDAYLVGANLVRANLAGANLGGANLFGANLGGAKLAGAILAGANLFGANLGGAILEGATLFGAILEGANLGGANLVRANLVRANLAGANLTGAILEGADLARAHYDADTRWPEGFNPQKHGAKQV